MMTASPKSTTSSNQSIRAESNGNGPSPPSILSPLMNSRDRSRSPQQAKCRPGSNNSLNNTVNIKEEDEHESSPHKLQHQHHQASAESLLAANYFANNHLKLAENLINHGGANFLNTNLLQQSNKNSNEILTSPLKSNNNNDDDGGSITPHSVHHHNPMGSFERKDFDFSKVNGE